MVIRKKNLMPMGNDTSSLINFHYYSPPSKVVMDGNEIRWGRQHVWNMDGITMVIDIGI